MTSSSSSASGSVTTHDASSVSPPAMAPGAVVHICAVAGDHDCNVEGWACRSFCGLRMAGWVDASVVEQGDQDCVICGPMWRTS